MDHFFKDIDSPVGRVRLIANDKGLVAILWENDDPKRIQVRNYKHNDSHPVLLETEKQLGEYFSKRRESFDIPLDFVGTEFQKKVWNALLEIPYGETRTYGEIAKQIENPKSQQAVGAANHRNPISIIAPCHRVIGASGKLVGFAGGLRNKAILLEIENKTNGQVGLWDSVLPQTDQN